MSELVPNSRRARGVGFLRDAWPLVALLVLAVALRVFLSLVYQPAALNQFDANSYVWQAEGGLFESYYQAPGYSLFLRIPHLISDEVWFTISVQHLVALVTATLLWWIVRRLTGSRWLGLIPAAVVLLNGDALLLEHSLMSETLFTLVVVGALAAAITALDSSRPLRPLVLCGALIGAAIWIRYAAVALVPVFAIWTLVVLWPRRRIALAGVAAVVVPVAAMVGALIVAQGSQTGVYALSESGGWALYSRVAEFADCDQFDPGPEARRLCETTAPAERRWPDWYGYNPRSPAVRAFEGPPAGDDVLGEFARRTIVAQPLDYAETILSDLWMYVSEASWTNRDASLIGSRSVSFRLRYPDSHCDPSTCRPPPLSIEAASITGWTDPAYGAYYSPFTAAVESGIEVFQDLQPILRMHGPLLGVILLVSVLGLAALRGRSARAQWLVVAVAVTLVVAPVATTTYNIRYVIPALPVITLGAALALPGMRAAAARATAARGIATADRGVRNA
jgi:hypothetical protein